MRHCICEHFVCIFLDHKDVLVDTDDEDGLVLLEQALELVEVSGWSAVSGFVPYRAFGLVCDVPLVLDLPPISV
jgi:hypothetical protein